MVRPLLTIGANRVVTSPANAPRSVTVHGTQEQLAVVRSTLEDVDASGSAACSRPAAPVLSQ